MVAINSAQRTYTHALTDACYKFAILQSGPPPPHPLLILWGVPDLNYKTFNCDISGNHKDAMNIIMNIQETPSLNTVTKRLKIISQDNPNPGCTGLWKEEISDEITRLINISV